MSYVCANTINWTNWLNLHLSCTCLARKWAQNGKIIAAIGTEMQWRDRSESLTLIPPHILALTPTSKAKPLNADAPGRRICSTVGSNSKKKKKQQQTCGARLKRNHPTQFSTAGTKKLHCEMQSLRLPSNGAARNGVRSQHVQVATSQQNCCPLSLDIHLFEKCCRGLTGGTNRHFIYCFSCVWLYIYGKCFYSQPRLSLFYCFWLL